VHALLTNHEAAAAAPAKGNCFCAAVASFEFVAASTGMTGRTDSAVVHGGLRIESLLFKVVDVTMRQFPKR
jgi:hypothetical protein